MHFTLLTRWSKALVIYVRNTWAFPKLQNASPVIAKEDQGNTVLAINIQCSNERAVHYQSAFIN